MVGSFPGCCARRERPCHRRAAEQRDELAPLHSITSSARERKKLRRVHWSKEASSLGFAPILVLNQIHLLPDYRHNDGSDHQATVLPFRRE